MALAHAILASLVNELASGYDLAKRFDSSVGFFWKTTHQQIYRELTRMEEQGWLSTETIHQAGRPDKKLYSVTELGKQQMRQWIAQPLEVSQVKEDILVKLHAGHLVDPAVLLSQVQQHRADHSQQLAIYRELEAGFFAKPEDLGQHDQLVYLTLRCGIRYEEGWIAWCDEAIALLQRQIANQEFGSAAENNFKKVPRLIE